MSRDRNNLPGRAGYRDGARLLPAGDRALVVEFGNEINPRVNRLVRNLYLRIQEMEVAGIEELIPTYRSLLIIYEPAEISYQELRQMVETLDKNLPEAALSLPKVHFLPVVYGGSYGPDLVDVAAANRLTEEEVIAIHQDPEYMIYMFGFAPGFPYLGGMSPLIATPRLEVPRTRIPAGSVGIAGSQTGVYPLESPGGWRLIGRTPVKPYDAYREPQVVFSVGEYLKFFRITEEEYLDIKAEVDKGCYEIRVASLVTPEGVLGGA
ncbi:MAG TPA: 5-oxoprolinase subunit PxpB [Spirochaetia bacterium]|nr:5-oxoprolinase subunit PxpB [Spirochaetia bacterium]